jgi:hypothetical protein
MWLTHEIVWWVHCLPSGPEIAYGNILVEMCDFC